MDGVLKNRGVWGHRGQFHTSPSEVGQSLTGLTPLFPDCKGKFWPVLHFSKNPEAIPAKRTLTYGEMYVPESREFLKWQDFSKSIK